MKQGWTATGVIEAPLERVRDTFLVAHQGPVGKDNAPLLRTLPGAGRFLTGANLTGGPHHFTVHYGTHPGGTVEVTPTEGRFAFGRGHLDCAASPSRAATSSAPSTTSPPTREEPT
jgi:hypothetical protein